MLFISYAQNFEDVILWRAFRDLETGFYIDVGAAHPDVDSVTRAFYDRGWHGINVEPSSEYFSRLSGARSRDTNLNLVIGSEAGEATFFQIQGTGLSTLDPDIADKHRRDGWPIAERKVQQLTLAEICRQHAPRDIHFLKVDVEGAEREVLAGADFETFRPHIILVEATRPNSQEENHSDWEHIITGSRYEFVYFDGLNRFYVANERLEALRPHFRLPPNVFDNFLRGADVEVVQRIRSAETVAAEAREARLRMEQSLLAAQDERQRAEQALNAARQEVGQAQGRLRSTEQEAERRQARIQSLEQEAAQAQARMQSLEQAVAQAAAQAQALAQAQARTDALQASLADKELRLELAGRHIDALRSSTSWRLTAPLRSLQILRRGQAGLALMEAGLARPRVERLGRVAGPDGRMLKRGARVMFYGAMRLLDRLPGSTAVAARLDRQGSRPWRWLALRGAAYMASARADGTPKAADPALSAPALLAPSGSAAQVVARDVPPVVQPGWAIAAVHQFHSGSAVGDAITNGMLLTRSLLRSLGYSSEIYVQHRDPGLADELLLLDDLPLREDCILLLHHSMGHDVLDRLLALPARKILVYHNITPVEFLGDAPWAIPYAELGRRMLRDMQPYMAAALADSEYNAQELRACGYANVAACNLLFDVDALLSRARPDASRPQDAPFTVLFVGRVTANKAQADLVDAFAAFRDAWGRPCRLVLVGHLGGPDAPYPAEIRRRVAEHGLEAEVLLTGPVPDDELHGWYRAADLYVSLSQHEGFGVPLVEAMAHRVPVIAWPAGAVPYTLGHALGDEANLLPDRQPATVAAAMLRFARDPALAAAAVARQLRVIDRFRQERQLPQLLQALAAAGAVLPPSPEGRGSVAANLRFALAGHINKTYSLASTNRTTALALDACRPGAVRVLPVEGVPTRDLSGVPASQAAGIAALVARPAPSSGPEAVLSHHYPVHVPEADPGTSIAIFAWEETSVPPATVQLLNTSFRAVFAISSFVARALVDSGLSIPAYPEGIVIDLTKFSALADERKLRQRPDVVTFLHVSSCFPRKGVDVLLEAYAKAFRRGDRVRLVIKGFPNPHNDVPEQIERLRQAMPDLAEIVMINEDIDEEPLIDLYRGADAVVLPSRGEGYNMPAAEAMAAGIPLIVTGHGGHLDFCTGEEARLVDFRFAPAASHLARDGSFWVEPDVADLAAALREVADDILAGGGACAARAARARAAVLRRLDPGAVARRMIDNTVETLLRPVPPPMRVAWVSTWDVPCGVAEYSRSLLTAMLPEADEHFATPVVFCDRRTMEQVEAAGPRIEPVWYDTSAASTAELASAIARSDPDAVVIQHQPGLITWQGLTSLLNDRRLRERVSVVVLHTTQHLMEIDAADRAAAIAAMARASRVLVHRLADLEFLRRLGLSANVTVFPQGAPPQAMTPAPRILDAAAPDASPVIGCFGFFLPGKGIPRLIAAAAELRKTWPHLRVKLVNSEYPVPASAAEIALCRRLAEDLGIADCIEWDTGFLPVEQCLALLSECDILVLPYDETKESSSSAVRTALASGVPVAVTPVAIFDDAGPAVHRFEAIDTAAVATGIDALLRDAEARTSLKAAGGAWLEARSWPSLGQRLRGMLLGLRAQRAIQGEARALPAPKRG